MKEGYRELLTAVVKEEKRIVKDVAVREANKIEGLKVGKQGNVEKIERDGSKVFEDLYKRYKELGFGTAKIIIKKAIQPVLEKYPDLEVPDELID